MKAAGGAVPGTDMDTQPDAAGGSELVAMDSASHSGGASLRQVSII